MEVDLTDEEKNFVQAKTLQLKPESENLVVEGLVKSLNVDEMLQWPTNDTATIPENQENVPPPSTSLSQPQLKPEPLITIADHSHFITNREITEDTTIVEESCAFYSPQYHRPGAQVQFRIDQLCVTCGSVLHPEYLIYPCELCHWPVCSKECAQAKIHTENECKFFTLHNIPFKRPSHNPIDDENQIPNQSSLSSAKTSLLYTNLIAILRGKNLKYLNPSLYNLLLEELSETKNSNKQVLQEDFKEFLAQLNSLVQIDLSESASEFQILFELIHRNHHTLGEDKFQVNSKSLLLLFPRLSKFIHSCIPNCSVSIGSGSCSGSGYDLKVRVRTSSLVGKGEILKINKIFLPDQHYLGTSLRRSFLRVKGIECMCERCEDSSECGLFTSGLSCRSCTENNSGRGYLLPFYNSNDEEWKCTNYNYCNHKIPSLEASFIVESARKEIQEIVATIEKQVKERSCFFVDQFHVRDVLAERIEKCAEKYSLHRNHYLVFNAIRETLLLPSYNLDKVLTAIPSILEKRMERLRFCLLVEDVFSPGLSLGRAQLLVSMMTLLYAILSSPSWVTSMKRKGPEGVGKINTFYELFKQSSEQSLKFFRKQLYVMSAMELRNSGGNLQDHSLAQRIPIVIQTVEQVRANWFDK